MEKPKEEIEDDKVQEACGKLTGEEREIKEFVMKIKNEDPEFNSIVDCVIESVSKNGFSENTFEQKFRNKNE